MNRESMIRIVLVLFLFLLTAQPLIASTYDRDQIRKEMISKEVGGN